MNHFSSGISLLTVIREGYGIEFSTRIFALQDAAGIFPSNCRPRFHLSPTDVTTGATTLAALGDKIINTPDTFLVTCIPILNRRLLNISVIKCHQFNYSCMELVGVEHRRGAALKVTDAGGFFRDDQCAFKLTRIT